VPVQVPYRLVFTWAVRMAPTGPKVWYSSRDVAWREGRGRDNRGQGRAGQGGR